MKFKQRTTKNITSNFLTELLQDRGIDVYSQYQKYFFPTIENEEPAVNLDHMLEGYECLKKHLKQESKIYLVVDSDVDGYTSSAVLWNYLKQCELFNQYNFSIEYHIPQGKEHGLRTLMDNLGEKKKYDLIILPDASSNDYDEHKILTELGYDILVLDHHLASHYSENAIVINNQLSTSYSNKSLSGVGVVYKFIEFFHEMWLIDEGIESNFSVQQFLDLVALGEISDVMDMTTLENRWICDYGLSHITNKFFSEMIEKQSYSLGTVPPTQIGIAFYVTPLINSLIRMGGQLEKERLFEAFINPDTIVPSTKRGEKGLTETIVTQSVRNCVNAKSRQKREMEKAVDLLNIQIHNDDLAENKIIIVSADELEIPNTLTGLCAMSIASAYKKPVLLGRSNKDGYFKGSMRGCNGSELQDFKAFLLSSGLMEYVEGHANAAGYSLPVSDISKLIEYANKELANIDFNEGFYEADFILQGNCSYISELIYDLDKGKFFWGQGCPEPLLIVENIIIDSSNISIIGSGKDTIRFTFNGITYVKFKAKELIDQLFLQNGKLNISVAGRSNVNEWGGKFTPQILIDTLDWHKINEEEF